MLAEVQSASWSVPALRSGRAACSVQRAACSARRAGGGGQWRARAAAIGARGREGGEGGPRADSKLSILKSVPTAVPPPPPLTISKHRASSEFHTSCIVEI